MRARVATAVLIILAALVTVAVVGPGVGGAAEPSPSPSPSASPSVEPTPTATPVSAVASANLVRWALKWQRIDRRVWRHMNRARRCLNLKTRPFDNWRPARKSLPSIWREQGKQWKHESKRVRAKTARLVKRMKHPGGSGAARWWPAARYCGWPAHLKGWFCYVVWRESNARPQVVNSSSQCWGLLQLAPCHWQSHGVAWIRDVFNQLRLGWKLYRGSGAAPWAL